MSLNVNQASRKPYETAAAWTADQMRSTSEWIYTFSNSDLRELQAAVELSQAVPLVQLTQATFPLQGLGEQLRQIEAEVVHGRGFILLRGLPVDDWDRETTARVYCGLGCWLGDAVPQNAAGHILGHVKDIGQDPHNPEHRVYATNYRHLFHTDSADLVGLLCLHPAKEGGQSAIASSTSIYNELLANRPDLVETLCAPFHVDRKGEVPPGKRPTYELAVFHPSDGFVTTIYARDFIEAAQRFPEVPRLTPRQSEAMDQVDELAASDRFRLDMDFQNGDIQILHNHQILHARTSYTDYDEPERKRHLLRLWLSARNGRELPAGFAERYGEIAVGSIRGGIRVEGQILQAPLEAD